MSAACPVCGRDRQCSDWDGDPARAASGMRIRVLTKHEEGGDRRTGKAGAHADFILAVRRQGPGHGRRRADARELRIMVRPSVPTPASRNSDQLWPSTTSSLKPPGDTALSRTTFCTFSNQAITRARRPPARVPSPHRIGQSCLPPPAHPPNPALSPAVRSQPSSAMHVLCVAWPTAPVSIRGLALPDSWVPTACGTQRFVSSAGTSPGIGRSTPKPHYHATCQGCARTYTSTNLPEPTPHPGIARPAPAPQPETRVRTRCC